MREIPRPENALPVYTIYEPACAAAEALALRAHVGPAPHSIECLRLASVACGEPIIGPPTVASIPRAMKLPFLAPHNRPRPNAAPCAGGRMHAVEIEFVRFCLWPAGLFLVRADRLRSLALAIFRRRLRSRTGCRHLAARPCSRWRVAERANCVLARLAPVRRAPLCCRGPCTTRNETPMARPRPALAHGLQNRPPLVCCALWLALGLAFLAGCQRLLLGSCCGDALMIRA